MVVIRSCVDLKNNYNDIATAYDDEDALAEEMVNRKMEEEFNNKYPDFESFQKDLYEKIEIGLKQIEEGKYRPMEEFCKEMEEEFNIHE